METFKFVVNIIGGSICGVFMWITITNELDIIKDIKSIRQQLETPMVINKHDVIALKNICRQVK